jgi:hypothetical protein
MKLKKIIIIVLLTISFIPIKAQMDGHVISDTYYLTYSGGISKFELQTYEIFPNQIFWAKTTVKTLQSHNANEFSAKIGLPNNFNLYNDVYDHPNLPINSSTNYEWITTWNVNSSDTNSGIYTLNVSENFFHTNRTADIIVNPGPTLPYNITVKTDKNSYSIGENGNVFVYIFDRNNYPYNVNGTCDSTIYYPDGSFTSFKNVSMVYLERSRGEYVSSNGFQAWNVQGIYTVETNCNSPVGSDSTTFSVGGATTNPTTAETTSPGTTSPPSPPSPPGPILEISNFTVDKEAIDVTLTPGDIEKRTIIVSNTGDTSLDIVIKLNNLDLFSKFPDGGTVYTIKLNKSETKTIEVNFFASKDQKPGVYTGSISLTSGSIERIIAVAVEVESIKPLFDVKVEVPPEYKLLHPGEKVAAQLTLYNLGGTGRVDVDVNYGIKDLSGNIIFSEHEVMAIETQISTLKTFNLPTTIKPSDYIFYATVSYNDTVGTGSSMFKVVAVKKVSVNLFLIIVVILAIASVLFIIYISKKEDKKLEENPYKK